MVSPQVLYVCDCTEWRLKKGLHRSRSTRHFVAIHLQVHVQTLVRADAVGALEQLAGREFNFDREPPSRHCKGAVLVDVLIWIAVAVKDGQVSSQLRGDRRRDM